jgi:nucleoside-diphosphate-sugar epimerase
MNGPDWRRLHGKAFEGRRVLVTGGAGFIGSHLIEALLVLGAEVVALDDLSGGSWDNLAPFGDDVRKITASVTDADAVRQAVKGCTYAFHEAALASVPQSVAEPQRYYDVNLNGTLVVATAAREAGVRRLVFAGSSSAYGDPPGEERAPKHEALPPLPLSPYASSKTACEELLRAWSHSYGLDTAVLRYFNVFGHRQNANSAYAAVIAAFAKALAEGRRPIIFGDGEQTRDFVFVQNVVHANLLAARHPGPLVGEIFNVATGATVTVNELFRGMAREMGKGDAQVEYRPPRTGDVRHSSADVSKAKRALGYEPIVSFEEGLRTTVQWYGSHR